MAKVLFPASMVGSIVLPPMLLFHPMQLMVSAVIAGRYARRPGAAEQSATDRLIALRRLPAQGAGVVPPPQGPFLSVACTGRRSCRRPFSERPHAQAMDRRRRPVRIRPGTCQAAADANKANFGRAGPDQGHRPRHCRPHCEQQTPHSRTGKISSGVQGIGPGNAAKMSGEGLTINGQSYKAKTATPATTAKPANTPPAPAAKTPKPAA